MLNIVDTKRGKTRPKKYWEEVIRYDMTQVHLTKDMHD